jgi:hypothetical protein
MIGIAENNFRAQPLQILRGKGLDRRLGADRYECGGVHLSVPRLYFSQTGTGLRVLSNERKHYPGPEIRQRFGIWIVPFIGTLDSDICNEELG